MKRMFLVHCWSGKPSGGWYSWIHDELQNKDFEVHLLLMPNPDVPEIDSWVNALSKTVKRLDQDTYFIGHSVGCQAILRYLEKQNNNAGGVFLVAPWINLVNLESPEAENIIDPWLKTKIDLNKVRSRAKEFVVILSDDDPWVPLSDAEIFKNKLNAKIIIEKNKGHYTEEDGVTAGENIPVLLEEILRVAKK